MVGGIKLLETLKVDDVVGAIPAHLIAGIWGTIAASITGGATFHVQLIGIVAVGAFAFGASWLLWQGLAGLWARGCLLRWSVWDRTPASLAWNPTPSSC